MKNLLSFLFFITLQQTAFAQKVELGVSAGIANYTGDIAPNLVLSETKWCGGIFARLNVNNTWAFTAIANQLRVSGSDANFSYNAARNITFRTDITEFAGLVEFNYFKYGTGVRDVHFTPFVYWGLGAAFYNPQGEYKGSWYDLRDYKTEGADNAYNGVTAIMPMGFGIKWMPNKNFSLEWSIGGRKTYTDYLDDVSKTYIDPNQQYTDKGLIAAVLADPSYVKNEGTFMNKKGYQRGNPDFNDWYFNSTISISYRIFTRIKCSRFY